MKALINPNIYDDVPNWWYHYYSKGDNEKFVKSSPEHFSLSSEKITPDFSNHIYNYGVCHHQIGENVFPGKSIVIMKTTVGCNYQSRVFVNKHPYITGYFRVHKINRENELIYMDPSDSLLLLDNPIKLDAELAKKLFVNKASGYWDEPELFVRRLGSTLRNRMARPDEVRIVVEELITRRVAGAKNYLGEDYDNF